MNKKIAVLCALIISQGLLAGFSFWDFISVEKFPDWQDSIYDPKNVPAYYELLSGGQTREMELPHFEGQGQALGYSEGTLKVPEELSARVAFWKRIYSEVSSDKALLHDSEYPQIQYGVISLGDASCDDTKSYREKTKSARAVMKAEKEKIVNELVQISKLETNIELLTPDQKVIFDKFSKITESNKFAKAADRVRAQIGQRDRIVQGFFFSGRYLSKMMTIFERHGLPKELTRLPFVESAFNLNARSKVGASGIWQFMRSTGKKYLRIDKDIDERNDPIRATHAAAELLRHNYESLEAWPLAITAYNHGREGMMRAVRELATIDLTSIIQNYRGRRFGFASSNFFSEFLAILELEREYRKHFGKIMTDSSIAYEELNLDGAIAIKEVSKRCGSELADLAQLNPAFTDRIISGRSKIPKGYAVRVPVGRASICLGSSKEFSTRLVDELSVQQLGSKRATIQ